MLHYFEAAASRLSALPTTLPDGSKWPKISIITPSYNQGKYIESTILSVLGQQYPHVEHIIIDACSTDETSAILDKYRPRLSKVIQESDKGQSDAINKGMRLATGDILTWLNSDDMLAPGALAAIAMGFHVSGADIVAGMCQVFNNGVYNYSHLTSCAGGPLSAEEISDLNGYWLQGKFFYQPEVMFTRELWERSGGYVREDLHWCMDVEMWLRFAAHDAIIHVVNAPIAMFRVHEEQKTSDTHASPKEYIPIANQWRTANGFPPLPDIPGEYHEKPPLRVWVNNAIAADSQPVQVYIERVVASLRAFGATCVFSETEPHDLSFHFAVNGELIVSTPADGLKKLEVPPCAEDFVFFWGGRQKIRQQLCIPEHSFVAALYIGAMGQELDADAIARRIAASGTKVIRFGDKRSSTDSAPKRAELLRAADCFIYWGSAENTDTQFLAEAALCGVPSIAFVNEADSVRLAKYFPWVHCVPTAPEEWFDSLPALAATCHDKAVWSQIHARSYLSLSAVWRALYLQMKKRLSLEDRLKKNLSYRYSPLRDDATVPQPRFQEYKERIKKLLPPPVWFLLRRVYIFFT